MATGSFLENDMDIKDCRDCKNHRHSRSTYWPKLLCKKLSVIISAPVNRLEMSKEDMISQEKAKQCKYFQEKQA